MGKSLEGADRLVDLVPYGGEGLPPVVKDDLGPDATGPRRVRPQHTRPVVRLRTRE